MIDWKKLVAERDTWIEHNFPDRHIADPGESIMGVIEEVGELSHQVLKGAQGVRYASDEKAQDAIGDISVYLMGVMSFTGEVPTCRVGAIAFPTTIFVLAGYAGALANAYTYGDTGGYPNLCRLLVFHLEQFCKDRGWDYEGIVNTVWSEVMQRDWKAYPKTGRPPLLWE